MKEEGKERKSGCTHMNGILRSFFWDMFLLVYIDVLDDNSPAIEH
jgi:hypothetical protein